MITFDQVMELTRRVSSHTAFEDAECAALYELCCAVLSNGLVMEIGCQLGRTSSIILQVGRDRGYRSVHIDPYTEQLEYLVPWIKMAHSIGQPFTLCCMRTDQLHATEQMFTMTEFGIQPPVDLLLIDGDHTEDGVRKDCKFADWVVGAGGILCAHDYVEESLPDVYTVLRKFCVPPDWEAVGVAGTLGIWKRTL